MRRFAFAFLLTALAISADSQVAAPVGAAPAAPSTAPGGQAPDAAPAQFNGNLPLLRATTRNVVLDIVVTDGSGRPVRDLKREDFIVQENKAPQNIHLIDAPGPAGTTPTVPTRNIILLDEMNVRFLDLAYARQRLQAYFRSPAARGKTYSLMTLTTRDLRVVRDFTTDTETLAESVRTLPAVLPATGAADYVDQETELSNLRKSIGVIESIAHSLTGSPQHVNLLWITGGFPQLSYFSSSGQVSDSFDAVMRNSSTLFLNARFTIYTIDPFGVQSGSSIAEAGAPPAGSPAQAPGTTTGFLGHSIFNGSDISKNTNDKEVANTLLGKIDGVTGGRDFGNQNDIAVPLGEAVDEGTAVYTVSYSPSDREFHDEYRKISVKLNRPGLYARTRDGYYATSETHDATPEQLRAQLTVALDSPLPYRGLHVAAELARGNRSVHVLVGSQESDWHYEADSKRAVQVVAVAAYTARNKPVLSRQWQLTSVRKDDRSALPLQYQLPIAIPQSATTLRIAVCNRRGDRVGTTTIVLVPGSPTAPPSLLTKKPG